MVGTSLVLHRGAMEIARQDLHSIEAPPPTDTWFPVKHSRAVAIAFDALGLSGYQIVKESFGISRDGHRLFGTIDLATPLARDGSVNLAVGIRNSTDKSFPLGFCAGNRVFVCDNLAFRSELLVNRKHTRFGEMRFSNAIAGAVTSLQSFVEVERERVQLLQATPLSDEAASHFLLRSMEDGIVSAPSLPKIWKEWRQPSFDFGEQTRWRLLNAYTTVLGPRAKTAPNEYARTSIRLSALLSPPLPDVPQPLADASPNGALAL